MRIMRYVKDEIIHLLPAIIYFAVSFNLFHFAQGLLMRPGDIRYTSYLGATLGAILAGKVIFIAESMPFINLFPDKPIFYNISWKFLVYSIFVLLVQVMDNVIQTIKSVSPVR